MGKKWEIRREEYERTEFTPVYNKNKFRTSFTLAQHKIVYCSKTLAVSPPQLSQQSFHHNFSVADFPPSEECIKR